MSATADSGDTGSAFDRKTLNGEDYLVAPVVAHQEGVYLYPRENGRGIKKEYLPDEELLNTKEEWEDTPLTLSHPYDPEEEKPTLTTNSNAEYVEVGLFRDVVTNDSKLGGKTWIRESEIGEHGGALEQYVNAIEQQGAGEVSTGYRAASELDRGTYQGEQYTHVQTNLQPDHLALLVNETGNCSVEDGCGLGNRPNQMPAGVRMNHRAVLNVREEARRPEYEGTESEEWSEDWITNLIQGEEETTKSDISDLTLLGNSDADSEREIAAFPVVNPETGKLNEDALDNVLNARGSHADIPEESIDSAEDMARTLLEEEFDRDVRDNSATLNGGNWGASPGNHIFVDEGSTDEGSDTKVGILRDIRDKLNRLAGGDVEEPGGDSDDEDDDDAEIDADEDSTQTMSETTETLIEEHNVSEEVANAIEGTDCADNILEWAEKANEENSDPETSDSPDDGGDEGDEEEDEDEETTNSEIEELRAELDALKSELRGEEELTNKLKEEADLSDAAIEGMSFEAKQEVANSLDVDDDDDDGDEGEGQSVANRAGIPGETQFDYEVEEGDDDIPAPGEVQREMQEGDD